ncbi:lipid-A-disaccharide synthase, partial [Porticoccaceae bacterium]|nr:lipid-A-disaccharide synthase [Porticoccaceae bacterium]
LVPEFIQADATVVNLAAAVIDAFEPERREALVAEFDELHHQLAVDSGAIAAEAIAELVES